MATPDLPDSGSLNPSSHYGENLRKKKKTSQLVGIKDYEFVTGVGDSISVSRTSNSKTSRT